MKHASDRQLLDLLAAQRPPTDELARHLDDCDECRGRLETYSRTWDILGRVNEEDIPADLAMGIVQAAERQSRAAPRRSALGRLWDSVGPVGRAAAVIVAVSAAGFSLGRFTAPSGPARSPAGQAITSDEAAEAAFFDRLGAAPVGLSEALSMVAEPRREDIEP